MIWLYQTVLYQPLYNVLIFLYNIVPGNDIGIAIILITILIKLVLLPLSIKSIKAQKSLQDLQPKIDEAKKKFGDQKDKMGKEMMKIYKDHKVNPLSSCFPLLIQFPFLIAVYQVFRQGLTDTHFDLLYSFVKNPEILNPISLGIIDLSKPNMVLAVLAGIAQYMQTRMLTDKKAPKKVKDGKKDENMMAEMNKSMKYFMPFITIIIGASLPGGLTLYWFLTTVLTVVQQKVIFAKKEKTAPVPSDTVKAEVKQAPVQIDDKKKEDSNK